MASAIDEFARGLDNIWSGLGNALRSIGTALDNFGTAVASKLGNIGEGLLSIVGSIKNAVSDIWWKISEYFKPFLAKMVDIWDKVNEVVSYISPHSPNFFVKLALIPSDGYFGDKFTEVMELIKTKFGFATGVIDMMQTVIMQLGGSSPRPKLDIVLPARYGGTTVSMINFDLIDPYIPHLKMWIAFVAYFITAKSFIRRVPSIIYQ